MEQEKGGRSIYARITEQIAAAITAGAPTFEMPWHRRGPAVGRPENISSGQKYRGVNVIALWVAAQLGQYSSGYWASYRQWSLAGAQVRKGERGTPIVFYKRIERQASAGDEDEGRICTPLAQLRLSVCRLCPDRFGQGSSLIVEGRSPVEWSSL